MNIFTPSPKFSNNAHIKSLDEYMRLYAESISDPESFWARYAEELSWFRRWDKVLEGDFNDGYVSWFKGGTINVSSNCLDRHLNTWRKNKAAIIWQGEPYEDSKTYTYQELHRLVCLFANMLKEHGVKKGDRIVFYMPL